MANLVLFDLFPDPMFLIQIERKYGDSLTQEDIHGFYVEPKKRQIKKYKQMAGTQDSTSAETTANKSKTVSTQHIN